MSKSFILKVMWRKLCISLLLLHLSCKMQEGDWTSLVSSAFWIPWTSRILKLHFWVHKMELLTFLFFQLLTKYWQLSHVVLSFHKRHLYTKRIEITILRLYNPLQWIYLTSWKTHGSLLFLVFAPMSENWHALAIFQEWAHQIHPFLSNISSLLILEVAECPQTIFKVDYKGK